ncbi:formate/nitrite transporter family protein [Actinoplanes sp. N902-109]|uniref:formate/nitrite transporter family protein n=1 Tax=Actinoplanes sp. (strain N902-109) TaxID=649831 RepID=UPI00032964D6|nr:formate/nitrite transporter family protein [Actinoplanes sp. N902-109]AGL15991.1 formate/nitrite transporter [Actinoplanes sp. N902-109]
MAVKEPGEIARAAVESGVAKAAVRWDKLLVGSFLAGAYIAFGGLVAITVSAGLDPKLWGGLPTLFTGATFALGLVLVVIAGSHLLTGNMMLVPISALQGRVSAGALAKNLVLVLIGNLLGSLFVAYFLAVQTGVIGHSGTITFDRLAAIAGAKALHETDWQIFLRAVGCNWLVCLAVWIALAADSVSGKILGVFFPIMAFVAMGFDHVVANMFFLPAAIFAKVPGIGWDDTLKNWVFAFLGNLVGAVVFVATSYWYMYLRGERPDEAPTPGARSAR